MATESQSTRGNTPLGRRPVLLINAALVVVLGVTSLVPAQDGAGRARGDYAMVGGEFQGGGGGNAVYILDASNQELIAVSWDRTRKSLAGIGYRDLNRDSQERPGR
ncbi:MAG: hypothetical protein AAGB48_05420 [Planctomycetota bacterium]